MHVVLRADDRRPLARLSKHRVTRIVWGLYPLLVTFVIVATGNHFLADAVLGAVTAGLSRLGRQLAGPRAPDRLGLQRRRRPDGHARADAPGHGAGSPACAATRCATA